VNTYKKGKLTKHEKIVIKDNLEDKNFMEIAQLLNRDPFTVRNYIEKDLGVKTSLNTRRPIVGMHPVKDREFWPILEKQFTPPELDVFVYHWEKLQSQFEYDVLPTEELQIIDLIKTEIMMNRNLIQQKECEDILRYLKIQLEKADKEERQDLETKMMPYQQAIPALAREYRELQEQKNRLFKDLKATRSDRIKKIETSKESFISWIEILLDKPTYRKEKGLRLEKFRLSMIDEEVRMMAYHKYEDGKIDRPIMNEHSVEGDDE